MSTLISLHSFRWQENSTHMSQRVPDDNWPYVWKLKSCCSYSTWNLIFTNKISNFDRRENCTYILRKILFLIFFKIWYIFFKCFEIQHLFFLKKGSKHSCEIKSIKKSPQKYRVTVAIKNLMENIGLLGEKCVCNTNCPTPKVHNRRKSESDTIHLFYFDCCGLFRIFDSVDCKKDNRKGSKFWRSVRQWRASIHRKQLMLMPPIKDHEIYSIFVSYLSHWNVVSSLIDILSSKTSKVRVIGK